MSLGCVANYDFTFQESFLLTRFLLNVCCSISSHTANVFWLKLKRIVKNMWLRPSTAMFCAFSSVWKGVFLYVFLKFPPYKKPSRFIFVCWVLFLLFLICLLSLAKPPLVSDFLNASIFPCICCLLPENRQALFLREWGVSVVDYNIALTLVKLI